MPQLGSLKRVDPRTVWVHEAKEFTPWLRKNIGLLAETIGLDLDLVTTESPVGGYAVDLYAKDLNTGRWVIIENQLEKTDHSHLGQLLAYAAGKEAGVIIWISPEFRDEHRQTLDWLNEVTTENVGFFGIELELLQVDDSLPAPNFRLVAQPNEWGRLPSPGMTPRQRKYEVFFTDLLAKIKVAYPDLTRAKKASAQNWLTLPIGRSGFALSVSFAMHQEFGVELYIDTGDSAKNKAAFDSLLHERTAIESKIGEPLKWERLDDRRASRIVVRIPGDIEGDHVHLEKLQVWAVAMVGRFHSTLKPCVQDLKL
jgi:hypothetical protein